MALNTSNISKLGFGCMRFEGRATDSIDVKRTAQLVDRYLEAGGNYFDTAWAYPGSEAVLGEALVSRYPRDSFYLATKCVAWTHCEGPDDLEKQLQESLAALQTDYIDVYLMHNLGGPRTAAFRAHGAWEFMKSAKERGLVRHIGFSAHCTPEELEEFLSEFPETEVVQLQINYIDWENPTFRERECVEVANRHGVPIIAMEPVKGGMLANPPKKAAEILDEVMLDYSYAASALRFTASVDGVFCTLSGMNTIEMVEENCNTFSDFKPLDERELEAIDRAQKAMRGSEIVACTACDYCAKVCPVGVGISGSINAFNHYINYGDPTQANEQLGFIVMFGAGKLPPVACIRCGACEEACPQNLEILKCFDRIIAEIMPHTPPPPDLMKM